MSICDVWDLSVLLILFSGILLGFFSGAATLISYLFSLTMGLLSAKWLTPPTLFLLRLHDPIAEGVVAFFIFLFVSLVTQKMLIRLNHWVEFHNFYLLNSILGMLTGGMVAVLACFLLAWGICYFDETRPLVACSRSQKYLTTFSESLKTCAATTSGEAVSEIPINDIFFDRFLERLDPNNLPPENPLYGYPRVPVVVAGETPDAWNVSPQWTWTLGEEVSGNWVHRFLDHTDALFADGFAQ
ncbi:MAG: CvpA family protein [Planctomycetia bacterium]|nr:CvpA family protein [Planctomycetia bacterium]